MRSIHTDCKKIVSEYSDGQMPFYEYKAKMKKCMDRKYGYSIQLHQKKQLANSPEQVPFTRAGADLGKNLTVADFV